MTGIQEKNTTSVICWSLAHRLFYLPREKKQWNYQLHTRYAYLWSPNKNKNKMMVLQEEAVKKKKKQLKTEFQAKFWSARVVLELDDWLH